MVEAELPFSASTARRLMAISEDMRLSNPAHGQLLPQSWRTLYELTKLDDAAFNDALTVVAKPTWVTAGWIAACS